MYTCAYICTHTHTLTCTKRLSKLHTRLMKRCLSLSLQPWRSLRACWAITWLDAKLPRRGLRPCLLEPSVRGRERQWEALSARARDRDYWVWYSHTELQKLRVNLEVCSHVAFEAKRLGKHDSRWEDHGPLQEMPSPCIPSYFTKI